MKPATIGAYIIALAFLVYRATADAGGIGALFSGLGLTSRLTDTDQYGWYLILLVIFVAIVALIALLMLMSAKSAKSAEPPSVRSYFTALLGPAAIVIFALFWWQD